MLRYLVVLKVLDTPKWPANPLPADHKAADAKVGETVWNSLLNRYMKDESWQDPKTAPIIMRMQYKKK